MLKNTTALADLIGSFTAELERVVDAIVTTRVLAALDDLQRELGFTSRVPSPPTTRTARRTRTRGQTSAPPKSFAVLPRPKAPTIIPPGVKITRLPPGPVPREQTYSALRSQCRLPGCLIKNSGPRFDYFCRDHYATLNRDEREKYKAQWKAGHAPAVAAAPAVRAAGV